MRLCMPLTTTPSSRRRPKELRLSAPAIPLRSATPTLEYYRDWRCDYIVTFNEDIPKNTFGLYGKYGNYEVAFVYPDDITAGQSIRLVEGSGLGSWTFGDIYSTVSPFTCGAFNLSDDNRNVGKNMTVELVIWKEGEEQATTAVISKKTY